jgi:hypothetical protein
VDLPDQREGLAARPHLRDLRQEVGGEVRVCAEAQQAGGRFAGRRARDELRDDIQAALQGIACDVRVVGAEIVLLERRAVEPCARFEEELDDFDVIGEPALLDQPQVFELGETAEDAFRQRLDQPPLQVCASAACAATGP